MSYAYIAQDYFSCLCTNTGSVAVVLGRVKKKKSSLTSRNSLPQANKTARQALKESTHTDTHAHIHAFINRLESCCGFRFYVKHSMIISEQSMRPHWKSIINIVSALFSRKYDHMGVGTKRCDHLTQKHNQCVNKHSGYVYLHQFSLIRLN